MNAQKKSKDKCPFCGGNVSRISSDIGKGDVKDSCRCRDCSEQFVVVYKLTFSHHEDIQGYKI